MFRRTLLISTCLLVLLSAIHGQDTPQSNPGPATKTSLSKPPALKQNKKKTTETKPKPAKKSTRTKKKGTSSSHKKNGSASSSSKKSKSTAAASKSKSKKEKTEKAPKEKPVRAKEDVKPLKSETDSDTTAEDQPLSPPSSERAKKPLMNDSIPFMKTNKTVPAKPAASPGSSIWLKTIGSVLLILGLLFVGTWVVKKTGLAGLASGQSSDSPELKILTSVTPRNGQTISAVRFGDRVLLVGSTQNSFTLLAEDGNELLEEEALERPEKEFEFEGRPVSVSELLSRENESFDDALVKAEKSQLLGLGRLS